MLNMFKPDTPEPTPAEIAAKVKKTPAQLLAEQNVARLHAETTEKRADLVELIRLNENDRFTARVTKADAELLDLGRQTVAASAALKEMRLEHAERVERALAPRRAAAAARILDAIEQIRADIAVITAIQFELYLADSEIRHVPSPEHMAPIEALALHFRN